MKKLLSQFALLIVGFFMVSAALARDAVPIVDHKDIPIVTGSGKAASQDQVVRAIISAAQALHWDVSKAAQGETMSATLVVRGKHTAVVTITALPEKFSVVYQSSIDLKYAPPQAGESVGKIHPFYNRWVQDLVTGIQAELKKL